jgi:hypothetical protein
VGPRVGSGAVDPLPVIEPKSLGRLVRSIVITPTEQSGLQMQYMRSIISIRI